MARMEVHYSSKSNEWETPQPFFDRLNQEFHFTLDPASTDKNAKCGKHYTRADDGLRQSWQGHSVFCNPPYGRGVGLWIRKAYRESRSNPLPIVLLIAARPDTDSWHRYVMRADEIRFIRGRLHFSGQKNSAPFPSVVVVFRSALDSRGSTPVCKSISS